MFKTNIRGYTIEQVSATFPEEYRVYQGDDFTVSVTFDDVIEDDDLRAGLLLETIENLEYCSLRAAFGEIDASSGH